MATVRENGRAIAAGLSARALIATIISRYGLVVASSP